MIMDEPNSPDMARTLGAISAHLWQIVALSAEAMATELERRAVEELRHVEPAGTA